jgi:hypothetical protein
MVAAFPRSAAYKANLAIINCGTNDAFQDIDLAGAGDRMRVMLNNIWAAADMENTCVILSTVIPPVDPVANVNRQIINEGFRTLVAELFAAGKCVYLADMDPPAPDAGNGWINTATDLISDGTHPNVSQ